MSRRELVTEPISEDLQNNVLGALVEFLSAHAVDVVRVEYGFVIDRDLRGEKQGEDCSVPLQDLPRFIESGLSEGTIEWGGSSDCRLVPANLDLELMLCNDSDLHLSSDDSSLLMELAAKLFALGVKVYESGSLVTAE